MSTNKQCQKTNCSGSTEVVDVVRHGVVRMCTYCGSLSGWGRYNELLWTSGGKPEQVTPTIVEQIHSIGGEKDA